MLRIGMPQTRSRVPGSSEFRTTGTLNDPLGSLFGPAAFKPMRARFCVCSVTRRLPASSTSTRRLGPRR